MRWLLLTFLSLSLLACPRPESTEDDDEPTSETATGRSKRKREAAAIITMIQTSQREGLIDRDLAAFMRIWSDDARLISGRGPLPGPYDEVVPIARVETYWKQRGKSDAAKIEVSFKSEKARVNGDTAEVTWDTTIIQAGLSERVERERWLLRRTPGGWRVYENRVWPVSVKRSGKARTVYDETEWSKLDALVSHAAITKAVDRKLAALYNAQRYGEGHDVAVQATRSPVATEGQWHWRAVFAVNLYFFDDARNSFQRQLALNDKANVPTWAKLDAKPAARDSR